MKPNHLVILVGGLLIVSAAGAVRFGFKPSNPENLKSLLVEKGPFEISVPATASVQPENRIVVTPPVPGRLEKLLVEEGDTVEAGQVLAWMSSTDRAALLDAARAQGDKAIKEWEETYKPTPILAPSGGRVIARRIVPGQTMGAETALFEISDRLVIRAQVDETDIAKIQSGQKARVRVDALPEKPFAAIISRIGHQSTLVNNINTYEVLLTSTQFPKELRSGMTATVDFILAEKNDAVLLPAWIAGGIQNGEVELLVKNGDGSAAHRKVRVGRSDGEHVEVVSGLAAKDTIFYKPVDLNAQGAAGGPLGILGGKK